MFARALFPRTTNRYGGVTLHCSHFSVAEGLPQTPVWLWVYGQEVRAVFDTGVFATYPSRYDQREGIVHAICQGSCAPTRFASPQGSLLARPPHDSVVLSRPQSRRRPVRFSCPAQQWGLFAWRMEDAGPASVAGSAC